MCDILTKILEQGHSVYIITVVHIGIYWTIIVCLTI